MLKYETIDSFHDPTFKTYLIIRIIINNHIYPFAHLSFSHLPHFNLYSNVHMTRTQTPYQTHTHILTHTHTRIYTHSHKTNSNHLYSSSSITERRTLVRGFGDRRRVEGGNHHQGGNGDGGMDIGPQYPTLPPYEHYPRDKVCLLAELK